MEKQRRMELMEAATKKKEKIAHIAMGVVEAKNKSRIRVGPLISASTYY